MNSYKFNATANYRLRITVARYFNIPATEVYKKVRRMKEDIITTDTGEKYQLTLKKIEDE